MEMPDVRYALSGDVHIAYQVVGDGPIDLLFTQQASHLLWMWQQPRFVRLFERLASFSRLILVDRRGTGLSDRPRVLTLEAQMDDLRATLDDTGSERASLFGAYGGGQACALFAATYPERVHALALFNTPAHGSGPPLPHEGYDRESLTRRAGVVNPSLADDAAYVEWFVWWSRLAFSPGGREAFDRMLAQTDIRDILPAIRVPTLVLYRDFIRDDALELAALIRDADVVRLPGPDSGVYVGDEPADEVERFLGGVRGIGVPDSVLSTLLFTDIVGSTERAVELGNRAWRDLLQRHNAAVRSELARFGGIERDTAGDGFFATFDGPARAIRCAQAIVQRLQPLEIDVRAGVHTGECELHEDKLAGIAVTVGARIADEGDAGEVLVSQTVRDLVAGSGIEFTDRDTYVLKGVPGQWRLFAVVG